MNKIIVLIIILVLSSIFAFKNYKFNSGDIWKIEEQIREHVFLFPQTARLIHNKGFYLSDLIFENYLSYFSPSTFFCCSQFLILNLVTLIGFYGGFFVSLKVNSKPTKIILFWILVYPLFPSLILKQPSLLFMLPVIIPLSVIFLYSLFKNFSR